MRSPWGGAQVARDVYIARLGAAYLLEIGEEPCANIELEARFVLVLGARHKAIESVHARRRKIIKTRGHFPSDEAATKLIWLALRNITADWSRATREWKAAMNQFAILYGDRFTQAAV